MPLIWKEWDSLVKTCGSHIANFNEGTPDLERSLRPGVAHSLHTGLCLFEYFFAILFVGFRNDVFIWWDDIAWNMWWLVNKLMGQEVEGNGHDLMRGNMFLHEGIEKLTAALASFRTRLWTLYLPNTMECQSVDHDVQ
jgi:hypothetical protein